MSTAINQDDGSRDALQKIVEARRRAAREGKHVAVVFGASWCPDSLAFDELLQHRLVKPLIEPSFVVVALDVGQRDRCLLLMTELGLDPWRGIPALAILDPKGAQLGALRDGELRHARSSSPLEIVSIFHRWAPEGAAPATEMS